MKKSIVFFLSFVLMILSCKKEPDIPTGLTNKIIMEVNTDFAQRIDSIGIAGATIVNLGYLKEIKQHGHCWATTSEPDITHNKTQLGALKEIISFNSTLTGLDLNTTYYVRAYIANATHVSYGDVFTIKSVCGGETELTYDGQLYKIVSIGNQCWMAKNLNAGTYIASTTDATPISNAANNGFIEKYCYNNNPANCDTYGALYDWDELMMYNNEEGAKGICPNGWHIPSNYEWEVLINYLGGYSVAGAKLKPNMPYQFDALMGGYRLSNGIFTDNAIGTRFWTSSLNNEGLAYYRHLNFDSDIIVNTLYNRKGAFHVRCIKNN